MNRVITLLTDFGTRDAYVGVMKGVIAQICPAARLIDLTHEIPPQDVAAAQFNLLSAVPYFPSGTVHLAVVDPGVGTLRRAIALQTPVGYCVGPDNGLFSGILAAYPDSQAVAISNPDYWWVSVPSQTFHGRDIFAPVAAHLASGVAIADLGPAVDLESLVRLPVISAHRDGSGLDGTIQYIDRFGNLITTIPGSWVDQPRWTLGIGDQRIEGVNAYGEGLPQQLVALVGSHGWVEVAVNGGNAQTCLQVQVGARVRVQLG